MQDFAEGEHPPLDTDQLTIFAPLPKEKPGRSTGPRSSEGKAASSMNRLTHGLRSEKAVLPGEDRSEYQATVENWFEQYDPHDHDEILLVEETALAHWHLQRASKRLAEIEVHLPSNAWNWTDEHQRLFSNFSRYKTTAERALLRWYRELEAYQGRQFRDQQAAETLRIKTAAVELEWLKRKEKSAPEALKVRQLVQIEQQGERCLTSYYPSNEHILAAVRARPIQPLLFERTLEFLTGVPPEYDWTHPNLAQRSASCSAIQRFFYENWLEAAEREKTTGHAGPMNLFRWEPPATD